MTSACDLVRPLAPELALGTLAGPERAAALAHLDACADCRREVEELSAAADALLLAAVEVDAPVGFEVRLLDRIRQGEPAGPTGTGPRSGNVRHLSFGRRVLALAAAVAIVAGAGGALIGLALAPGGGTRPPAGGTALSIRTAALVVRSAGSAGGRAGEVAISTGRPVWMMMDVSDLSGRFASAWVSCVVETGSRTISVGQFKLSNGYGSWAVPLGVPGTSVRSARLVAPDGSVLATASF